MKTLGKLLDLNDRLNLYLVSEGLKPSALISFNTPEDQKTLKTTLRPRLPPLVRFNEPSQEHKTNIEEQMLETGLHYLIEAADKPITSYFTKGFSLPKSRIINREISATIGSTRRNLIRLLESRNEREKGIALGYPEDSVLTYGTVIDGERRDGTYLEVSLAKAKQAGIRLPEWLGYISFIPAKLDFISGNISESAREIGETYRDYVRENNPALAEEVEQHFAKREFPVSWIKARDEGYELTYKPVFKIEK